jgi:hypothetical protein
MLANTTQTTVTNDGCARHTSSIDLAREIETLFHLDVEAFHTLPVASQIAILAKAKHIHDFIRGTESEAK